MYKKVLFSIISLTVAIPIITATAANAAKQVGATPPITEDKSEAIEEEKRAIDEKAAESLAKIREIGRILSLDAAKQRAAIRGTFKAKKEEANSRITGRASIERRRSIIVAEIVAERVAAVSAKTVEVKA